jgi:dipeptidyl aminopeptidase/acylaminoacyl peptidase
MISGICVTLRHGEVRGIMNRHSTRLALLAAVTLGITMASMPTMATSAAAQKRAITEKDLFKLVWVADPQISPDGSRIAFVRVTVDEKKDQYDTAIWLALADGSEPPRAFTSGQRDTSPRWSADGRSLVFTRVTEKDGRPQPPQLFLMALGGGEPRAITDVPKGAANPAWAPDGKTIAFSSATKPEDLAAKPSTTKPEEAPHQSDVRVITEAVYRANGIGGSGFVDSDRPSQIWTVAVPASGAPLPTAKRITSGEFAAGNHRWSADGSKIFFVSDRRRESYYYPNDSDLYEVSGEGEPVRVASIEGSIGGYAPSPDGKRMAFVGTLHGEPERSYSQPDLWVVDLPGGTPRNLTATYDFDVNGSVGGDQRAPRGQLPAGPVWSADGRSIIIKVGEHGNTNLVRVDAANGQITPLTKGSQEILAYTADDAAARLAVVRSTATVVGDLEIVTTSTLSSKKLTGFNDELTGQLTMTEPEEIWYTSFDGKKIQGWILKPPGFNASMKYPLILEIHGGPHSAYGNTFTHEFHWMAAKGYVVLYTNPRGSSNYGQEFGNSIQFAYPGDDYKDLMAGVDEVVKRGYVDEARMGVTGGSGGGLLTNWVVTQTTRFKAAVSQRDISDWSNFWYTADFSLFTPTWFHKAPFEDPADFAKRSPITYVERIQTPLMFILGDEDFRTPPTAGGEDLFRALKYLKRSTVMVRFPGENHELSRSGKPWHRVERLQHIVGWFDKWLGGTTPGSGN